ncbi:hypothetical protein FNV43_RR04239 [Rhamnella rubrinervis]|uniref:Uncharacterized protein n=1 Tax=Rhamnella rubrinervis TaxID=2594499 RepID=A0A8K0HKM9_9ROSA|nr:hypothetical protein FNV43_RR04239 [Rhamnella rubrinervis]
MMVLPTSSTHTYNIARNSFLHPHTSPFPPGMPPASSLQEIKQFIKSYFFYYLGKFFEKISPFDDLGLFFDPVLLPTKIYLISSHINNVVSNQVPCTLMNHASSSCSMIGEALFQSFFPQVMKPHDPQQSDSSSQQPIDGPSTQITNLTQSFVPSLWTCDFDRYNPMDQSEYEPHYSPNPTHAPSGHPKWEWYRYVTCHSDVESDDSDYQNFNLSPSQNSR